MAALFLTLAACADSTAEEHTENNMTVKAQNSVLMAESLEKVAEGTDYIVFCTVTAVGEKRI